MGDANHSIDPKIVDQLVSDIAEIHQMGIKVCLVVGAGNILRGAKSTSDHLDRGTADLMGMLATAMNGLALSAAMKFKGVGCKVVSALHMPQVCETYERQRCLEHLENNQILIFVAGSGNPYFTTDTAAVLRALEMGCDVIMKGTQVDGVYSADPKTSPNATYFDTLDYQQVLDHHLRVVDMTAITLAQENTLPILIFNVEKEGALLNVIRGKGKYTLIGKEKK